MGWSRFFHRARWDDERSRELQSYLDIETDDNMVRGMSAGEARHAARMKLGNPVLIREEIYRMNSIGFLERLWHDLRYASRMLRRKPGFTTVAILSLALGIGVNTAMFSVIRAVLLRPLPYPQPRQLVQIGQQVTQAAYATVPEYRFLKEDVRLFSSIAAYRGGAERRLVWRAGQDWISTMTVSADFVLTLGVPLALGREFNADETQPGGPQAIILSDGLWRRSFGADPAVLGRAVTLDNASYTVVGVLRSDFWFPQSADALVPLRPTGGLGDTGTNTQIIARLSGSLTLQQAQTDMTIVSERFQRAHGGEVALDYRGLMVVPF